MSSAADEAFVSVKAVGGGANPTSATNLTVRTLNVLQYIQLGGASLSAFTLEKTFARVTSLETSLRDILRRLSEGGGGSGGGGSSADREVLLQLVEKVAATNVNLGNLTLGVSKLQSDLLSLQDSQRLKALEEEVSSLSTIVSKLQSDVLNLVESEAFPASARDVALLQATIEAEQVLVQSTKLFLEEQFERPVPLYTGNV